MPSVSIDVYLTMTLSMGTFMVTGLLYEMSIVCGMIQLAIADSYDTSHMMIINSALSHMDQTSTARAETDLALTECCSRYHDRKKGTEYAGRQDCLIV